MLQIIAPEFFEKLEPFLEAGDAAKIGKVRLSGSQEVKPQFFCFYLSSVCNEIDQWPPPSPGQTLNLPIVGTVLQVGQWGKGLVCR